MQKSIIRLTSVTYAIRAQKLLEQQGIRGVVKKFAHSLQVDGCGYGIEINPADYARSRHILEHSGIRIISG